MIFRLCVIAVIAVTVTVTGLQWTRSSCLRSCSSGSVKSSLNRGDRQQKLNLITTASDMLLTAAVEKADGYVYGGIRVTRCCCCRLSHGLLLLIIIIFIYNNVIYNLTAVSAPDWALPLGND